MVKFWNVKRSGDENLYLLFREIILLDKEEYISLKDLADNLGIKQYSSLFIKSIKLLKSINIIGIHKTVYANYSKVVIDLDKLENYIRENSQEFKHWARFIISTVSLANVGDY